MNSLLSSFLTNGALYISDSGLSLLAQCPREFFYKYGLRRQAVTDKPALAFGGAMHTALAIRYAQDPHLHSGLTEANMEDALVQAFQTIELPEGDHRTLDHAVNLTRAYNAFYGKEPFEVVRVFDDKGIDLPVVEKRLSVLLDEIQGIPVFYEGLVDVLVRENQGLWVIDHKTTSVMGDSYFRDLSVTPQLEGYCWQVWRTMKELPVGYRANTLPTNAPTPSGKVRRTKTGGYSVPFERPQTYINEARLLEWESNTCEIVNELFYYCERGNFPMHRKMHCIGKYGACEFFDVCSLPAEQRGIMLASGMFEDKVRASDEKE